MIGRQQGHLGPSTGVAREPLGLDVDEIDRGDMVAMSNRAELADLLDACHLETQRERRGDAR